MTTNDLVLVESYYNNNRKVSFVARQLNCSRQTIYNVYHALDEGLSLLDYYQRYKNNKQKCGRRPISLPDDETEYTQKSVAQGLAPDVIIGRAEFHISCSVRTLYRLFMSVHFDYSTLPLKEKRKPNGYKEKRGKQAFKRIIHQRDSEHKEFQNEFGHPKDTTIVGQRHKSAVIILVERLSKVIITLKPEKRQAIDIETRLNGWFKSIPKNLFKSITFDCGKEFSN